MLQVSQEEIIAERLGVMQFSHGGNTESELEKAESELLKIVGALGMQANQVCMSHITANTFEFVHTYCRL